MFIEQYWIGTCEQSVWIVNMIGGRLRRCVEPQGQIREERLKFIFSARWTRIQMQTRIANGKNGMGTWGRRLVLCKFRGKTTTEGAEVHSEFLTRLRQPGLRNASLYSYIHHS